MVNRRPGRVALAEKQILNRVIGELLQSNVDLLAASEQVLKRKPRRIRAVVVDDTACSTRQMPFQHDKNTLSNDAVNDERQYQSPIKQGVNINSEHIPKE